MNACCSGCSLPLCREALDRGDLRAIVHDGKGQARIDAPPVDENGAGAALALIAAFLCPGQVEMLAQQIKQRRARIEHQCMKSAVDGQAHRNHLRRCQAGRRLRFGARRQSHGDGNQRAARDNVTARGW